MNPTVQLPDGREVRAERCPCGDGSCMACDDRGLCAAPTRHQDTMLHSAACDWPDAPCHDCAECWRPVCCCECGDPDAIAERRAEERFYATEGARC